MFEATGAFLVSIGINPTHLSAGLAGSFVRGLLTGKSKWEVISGSLVGTVCAVYATPIVVQWFHLDSSQIASTNGVAFGIGILGLSLAEGAVRMAQRWAANPRLPTSGTFEGIAGAVNPQPPKQDEPTDPTV